MNTWGLKKSGVFCGASLIPQDRPISLPPKFMPIACLYSQYRDVFKTDCYCILQVPKF